MKTPKVSEMGFEGNKSCQWCTMLQTSFEEGHRKHFPIGKFADVIALPTAAALLF